MGGTKPADGFASRPSLQKYHKSMQRAQVPYPCAGQPLDWAVLGMSAKLAFGDSEKIVILKNGNPDTFHSGNGNI